MLLTKDPFRFYSKSKAITLFTPNYTNNLAIFILSGMAITTTSTFNRPDYGSNIFFN